MFSRLPLLTPVRAALKKERGFLPGRHDEEVRAPLENLGKIAGGRAGRAGYHITRLTLKERNVGIKVTEHPPDVEKRFALALIEYALKADAGEAETITELSKEGIGVNQWWTVAPYAHFRLSKRIGKNGAVRILLRWARASFQPHEFLKLRGP